jgi:hypothetical protein
MMVLAHINHKCTVVASYIMDNGVGKYYKVSQNERHDDTMKELPGAIRESNVDELLPDTSE